MRTFLKNSLASATQSQYQVRPFPNRLTPMTKPSLGAFAAAILALGLIATVAHATDRRFTYSYETTTAPKGSFEYEQWFTWQQGDDFDKYQFRHELEFGITDQLQLGLYLFDWEHEKEDGESETKWEGTGVELIYQLTDPNKSAFGSALYFEAIASDEELELEGKLLLQKNFGPLVLVYNLIVEAEWEDDFEEEVGVWENTIGLSYQVNPNIFIGVEATHEVEFEDWSEAGHHVVYAGPNVSFRKGHFFATLTGLFQATDVDDEADTQLRVIAGLTF